MALFRLLIGNFAAGAYCKRVPKKSKPKSRPSTVTLEFVPELLLVTSSY
jgi:hypothetical protein